MTMTTKPPTRPPDDRVIPPAELHAVALRCDILQVLDHSELERAAAAAELPAALRAELDDHIDRQRSEVAALRAELAELVIDEADPLAFFASKLGRELGEQERDDLGITAGLPPVSARTQALAKRLGHVAMDNTIARSPLALTADLRDGAGRLATAAQKAISAVFVKNFAVACCPTSGLVTASFAEISNLLGYGDRGGWQYEHIRDLVRGLRGAGVGGEWTTHDGDDTDDWYGIIQASQVTTKGAGSVTVRLTYDFQKSIRAARFTYLRNEQVRRLNQASSRSDIPLNFWYFLQSQRLPWPLGWPVFRAPEGATDAPADVRPLAEILSLRGKSHKRVVQRIRAAAKVIMAVFPEYTIVIEPAGVATMYQMYAIRRDALESLADRVAAIEAPAADPVDNSEEEAESVYEEGTAPCMSGVPAGVRAGYRENDETPAPTPGYYDDTVLKSQSLDPVVVDLRDTRFQGNPVSESEQPTDHDEDAEGQEKRLGAKPHFCPSETLVVQMTEYPDQRYENKGEATLSDLLAGSRVAGEPYGPAGVPLIDALALTVCRQFRNASGGAVCHGNETGNGIWAAEHLVDGGEVEWCPAWDALPEVALKIREYLGKRGQVQGSPAQYVLACIKRAYADPTELMGRTRAESKEAYRQMTALNSDGAALRAKLRVAGKVGERIPNEADDIAEHARHTRARMERYKTMTHAEIAADHDARRAQL
jgi:hypothetical protein